MPLNKEISADNLIQNYRLTSIKYRTYTIVLLILSIFARFYVSDLLPEYEDLLATAASADQQIETLDSAIKQARADQTLLTNMS
jgi:hypothetical protein